jgi:hypothetical protein
LPGQDLTIDLTWQVLQAPGRDYTVFAHLLDSQGVQVGGYDEPMTGGVYPTGLWAAGEVVTHTHTLRIPVGMPDGDYNLVLGVYDPGTGERLPVRIPENADLPSDSLQVVTLHLAAKSVFIPMVLVQPSQNP